MDIAFREILGNSKLYVAQSKDAPPTMPAVPHRHLFYEIAWLEYGDGTFICDFSSHRLHHGTLVFVAPGQIHTWGGAGYNLILIGFKASLFAQNWINPALLSALPYFDLTAHPFLALDAGQRAIFDYLFSTIYTRYMQLGLRLERYIELHAEHEQILLAYLHLILVEAERLYTAQSSRTGLATAAKALTVAFQRKVEETYQQRWQIQMYADTLGVTANYLAEVIRLTLGKTPSQVVQARLLLEAQRLLVYTESTISEIADQLSFATPTQFSQWFKRLAGQSPTQFREVMRYPSF